MSYEKLLCRLITRRPIPERGSDTDAELAFSEAILPIAGMRVEVVWGAAGELVALPKLTPYNDTYRQNCDSCRD